MRRVRRATGPTLALLLCALVFGACSDQKQPGPNRPRRATRALVPNLPRPRTSAEEERELLALARRARQEGQVRVLIGLPGLGRPALTRAPDGTLDLTSLRNSLRVLDTAQKLLLQRAGIVDGRGVTILRVLPYLAFDAGESNLLELRDFVLTGVPTPAGLTKITVEEVAMVRPQARIPSPARAGVPIADVLRRLEGDGSVDPGNGTTIAVIDTAIEPLPILAGRVSQRLFVAKGYPLSAAVLPDPAPLLSLPANLAHGTQVAIVAAATAPAARILSFEVDGGGGSYPFDLVLAALDWMLVPAEEGGPGPVAAVCLSAADPDQSACAACDTSPDQATAFHSALSGLAENRTLVALAAGNGEVGIDRVYFPGCMGTALVVGATDATSGMRAGYSNWCDLVDLAAPGTGVSCVPDATRGDVYILGPGTSISAPFVAGAVARLRATHTDASPGLIFRALSDSGAAVTDQGLSIPEIRIDAAARRLQELTSSPSGG